MPTEHRDPREPKAIRIRRDDVYPLDKCDTDYCSTAIDMRARLATLEREFTVLKSAFILNDLNLPDFDGHRSDHRMRKEAAKVMENYKITATHKVIAAIVAAFVLFFSTGITTKLQAIVQTKETK